MTGISRVWFYHLEDKITHKRNKTLNEIQNNHCRMQTSNSTIINHSFRKSKGAARYRQQNNHARFLHGHLFIMEQYFISSTNHQCKPSLTFHKVYMLQKIICKPFSVLNTFLRFRISIPGAKPTGSFSKNSWGTEIAAPMSVAKLWKSLISSYRENNKQKIRWDAAKRLVDPIK